MKRNLWSLSIIFSVLIMIASCQKQDTNGSVEINHDFNAAAAKEWYYGTFKKTSAWQSSFYKGKKLPDWKTSESSKIGKDEIVVFPLIQSKKSYAISSAGNNKSLSRDQIKRIAAASTSRIAFIKQPGGNIITREIEYIPDWNYLQTKDFDISKVNILGSANDFSGRVIVKNWDGKIISMAMLENGKTIKRGTIKPGGPDNKVQGNNVTAEQCFEQEFCVWQMDCTMFIYGDGMITEECTAWYNTGECWTETWCEGGGGPCELAEIGCGEDDRDGGDPGTCSQESVDNIVQSASTSSLSEKDGITTNSATPFSISRSYKWKFAKVVTPFGGGITFFSTETGVQDRGADGWWRWSSFNHNSVSQQGSALFWEAEVQSLDATPTITNIEAGGPVNVTVSIAGMQLNWNLKISYTCGVAVGVDYQASTSSNSWYTHEQ